MFYRKFLILLPLLFFSQGCVTGAVTGAFGAGKSLYQDKTVGEEISDQTIWTKIRAALVQQNIDSPVGGVNVKVSEGRVLLTGTVKHREDIVKVVKVCWEMTGVREVINELKVEGEVQGGLKRYAQDAWVTTRIKSKLLFSKPVKSVNYNVITIDGVVYLIGIARTQSELDFVTNTVSQVSGVKEVISYIRGKKNPDSPESDLEDDNVTIDDFNDSDITVEEKPTEKVEKNSSYKKQTKKSPSTKKASKREKDQEIFSDEDFDTF